MIHLTVDAAITLYFTLVVGLILVSWTFHLMGSKKKKPLSLQTKSHRCEYCSASYMEKTGVQNPRCPTCGSYNRPLI